LPFGKQLLEDLFAYVGEDVEALVALVFFAPFTDQQALSFEAAEEWIEGAFVYGHAVFRQSLAEGVAVLLGVELGEDGEDQRPAAEFHAEVFEEIVIGGHAVWHLLCDIHCTTYTVRCTVLIVKCFLRT
jgi:hypothetical protein